MPKKEQHLLFDFFAEKVKQQRFYLIGYAFFKPEVHRQIFLKIKKKYQTKECRS
jgi:hypothetical protein